MRSSVIALLAFVAFSWSIAHWLALWAVFSSSSTNVSVQINLSTELWTKFKQQNASKIPYSAQNTLVYAHGFLVQLQNTSDTKSIVQIQPLTDKLIARVHSMNSSYSLMTSNVTASRHKSKCSKLLVVITRSVVNPHKRSCIFKILSSLCHISPMVLMLFQTGEAPGNLGDLGEVIFLL
jgi:hypothetical protein